MHLLKLLCTLHGQSWVDMFQMQVQQQREGRLAGMKCRANGMLLLLSVYSIQGIDNIYFRDRHSVGWMTCMCAKHASCCPSLKGMQLPQQFILIGAVLHRRVRPAIYVIYLLPAVASIQPTDIPLSWDNGLLAVFGSLVRWR